MTDIGLPVPKYKIEEEDEEIIITISAPLAKPREAAFVLEKDVFTFESSPYLLKAKLPHPVSDKCKDLNYDSATGAYKVILYKISGSLEIGFDDNGDDVLEGEVNPSEHRYYFLNHPKNEPQCSYGFANKYSDMFGNLYKEFSEVINLPNPDVTYVKDRRTLRVEEENEKWSEDHYLADMMETDHLESIFMYKQPWVGIQAEFNLTDDEKEILNKLNKEAIKIDELSEKEREVAEYQLVEILFCYAYNRRTTEGENTVESGWTINKLSSTLTWFEEFESLKATLVSCYRRSLIYPLYRNWKLCEMVHNDVVDILKLGPKGVARCLIEVIEIFNDSDNRYLLNTLYVNNLCNYSINMTNEQLQELSQKVQELKITKYEVNHELPLLEIAAHLTLEEETGKRESEVSDIVDKITELSFVTRNESSCESDSGESTTQSSDTEN